MNFAAISDILKSHWRTIVPVVLVGGLFFGILFHYQLYLVLLGCSFIFSAVVFAIESRKISETIKGNIFIWLMISILYITTVFLTKVYATHYFNIKYDIFQKYLNYSIAAYAGIVGTTLFISIICFILFLYFLFQIFWQDELTKQITALIHSISCILIIAFSSIIYWAVDNSETLLLYFDAYKYSDCQTENNKSAIRKDDKTCYLIEYKGSLKWELKDYPTQKTEQ